MMRETSPAALQSRWHPCHPIPILLPLIHPHHQVQTLLPSLLPSIDPPAPTKAYPTHPDEDPKLQLGSRPPTKKPSTPAMQQDTLTSGGTSTDTTNTGVTLPDSDKDGEALFLTVDIPCSYQDTMA